MILTIASGKGGTGKTLVATSLALSLKDRENVQLLDCDVEEPNDWIFLRPEISGSESVSIPVPVINADKCTLCGVCARVCAYHAIIKMGNHVLTFPQLCHGCGACSHLCDEKAITEQDLETGTIEWGNADGVEFIQGRLSIGAAMAPPVIRKVKAKADGSGVVIIDAPPGTSCPVVETVKGSDFCLLVTEPTPFGLNDLVLAVEMIMALAIPFGVVLNRAGVGDTGVQHYCREKGIPIMLSIPLDTEIARWYSRGSTLVDGLPQWKPRFQNLFAAVKELLHERSRHSER